MYVSYDILTIWRQTFIIFQRSIKNCARFMWPHRAYWLNMTSQWHHQRQKLIQNIRVLLWYKTLDHQLRSTTKVEWKKIKIDINDDRIWLMNIIKNLFYFLLQIFWPCCRFFSGEFYLRVALHIATSLNFAPSFQNPTFKAIN